MNEIPFVKKLETTVELLGREFPIVWEFASHDDADGGWINGTVNVEGRLISVGGGWVDADGAITDYDFSDFGDIEVLAEALGIEDDDEKYEFLLYVPVQKALPASWSHADVEVVAQEELEFGTRQVLRLDNGRCLSRVQEDDLSDVVTELDEAGACKVMIEMGLEPEAISEKMNIPYSDEDVLVLAEDEGEWETEQLVRIGPYFFSNRVNGGSRGVQDGPKSLGVEEIDEDEVVRRKIRMDHNNNNPGASGGTRSPRSHLLW